MRMRTNIKLPEDVKELTPRHMDFIEKMETIRLESERARLHTQEETTLSDDHKATVLCVLFILVFLAILTVSCHIYFNKKNEWNFKENEIAYKNGYELSTIPGTSQTVWRKSNESK